MKMKRFNAAFLLILVTLFSSCEVIGGIFKAGVWSGIIIVVLVIVLIVYVIGRMGKK